MAFTVGETVVYPHHGAARIEEIKQRVVRGQEVTYLRLTILQGDLTNWVGAKFVVDTNIDSLCDKMMDCIEAKRAALGI